MFRHAFNLVTVFSTTTWLLGKSVSETCIRSFALLDLVLDLDLSISKSGGNSMRDLSYRLFKPVMHFLKTQLEKGKQYSEWIETHA
jgi:hypothetical protein